MVVPPQNTQNHHHLGGTPMEIWGKPSILGNPPIYQMYTLPGINISHLGKRKIIFKMPFWGDMLVPWRVIRVTQLPPHLGFLFLKASTPFDSIDPKQTTQVETLLESPRIGLKRRFLFKTTFGLSLGGGSWKNQEKTRRRIDVWDDWCFLRCLLTEDISKNVLLFSYFFPMGGVISSTFGYLHRERIVRMLDILSQVCFRSAPV